MIGFPGLHWRTALLALFTNRPTSRKFATGSGTFVTNATGTQRLAAAQTCIPNKEQDGRVRPTSSQQQQSHKPLRTRPSSQDQAQDTPTPTRAATLGLEFEEAQHPTQFPPLVFVFVFDSASSPFSARMRTIGNPNSISISSSSVPSGALYPTLSIPDGQNQTLPA